MVDIPNLDSVAQHSNDTDIVFVGKMSYEPNIVAVTYFANRIFPSLKSQFPDLNFFIVGANPDNRVQILSEKEGIKVTGFVESIEPYFKNSTIVVAPMLTGAGIQNKIIQAMSYGCCVATTSIGAEGLTIENDEISILNSTEEWISKLQVLLTDRNLRKQMGEKARKYIISNLSRDVISKQFWACINSIY